VEWDEVVGVESGGEDVEWWRGSENGERKW
jgi:hypothetical protein